MSENALHTRSSKLGCRNERRRADARGGRRENRQGAGRVSDVSASLKKRPNHLVIRGFMDIGIFGLPSQLSEEIGRMVDSCFERPLRSKHQLRRKSDKQCVHQP